jgi:hypothetical protein
LRTRLLLAAGNQTHYEPNQWVDVGDDELVLKGGVVTQTYVNWKIEVVTNSSGTLNGTLLAVFKARACSSPAMLSPPLHFSSTVV